MEEELKKGQYCVYCTTEDNQVRVYAIRVEEGDTRQSIKTWLEQEGNEKYKYIDFENFNDMV